jgi:hypothetical protein
LACNVKEQQNAAKGHTVQHTQTPTFYTEVLCVSAGCNLVGGGATSKMVKNWILHYDNVPCQNSLAVQQFLVKEHIAALLQVP